MFVEELFFFFIASELVLVRRLVRDPSVFVLSGLTISYLLYLISFVTATASFAFLREVGMVEFRVVQSLQKQTIETANMMVTTV